MDGGKFRDTMHSLNYGTVMEAAARDYMKEKMGEEARARAMGKARALDARDLCEVRERAERDDASRARRSRTRARSAVDVVRDGDEEMRVDSDFLFRLLD